MKTTYQVRAYTKHGELPAAYLGENDFRYIDDAHTSALRLVETNAKILRAEVVKVTITETVMFPLSRRSPRAA